MAAIDILNVGQGDSLILRASDDCVFSGETIFIDLGPGKYDITKHIRENEKIHIFLTHHDNDHLEGLRFFIGKMKQVNEITVPFYQNEITLIARAILNLKGIGISSDCNEFVKILEEVVSNQAFLKTLVKEKDGRPKLSFAYEGKEFCSHIECFNPPMLIDSYDWLHEMNGEDLVQIIYEVFTDEFAKEMELYIQDDSRQIYRRMDVPEFSRFFLYSGEEQDEARNAKRNYVLSFILDNITLLRNFNNKASRDNLKKIYKNYVKCTHDVCVVLKTSFDNTPFLFTGDASKKVFNRLIRENKDISAIYLKMPHHGSKHNMNEKILKKIKPKTAIISHNNGHFGESKDTHPNQEILNLLQKNRVRILITNDIIKNNMVIMKKNEHKNDCYVHIN